MTKKYIFQLKEKTDEVFNLTTSKLSHKFGESKIEADGTVQIPVEAYSLAFNDLHRDFTVKFSNEFERRYIFRECLFNISTIFETSVFLAVTGFYYSANSELRNALDHFITSTYFDVLDEKGELLEYWVDEKSNFISWKKRDNEILEKEENGLKTYLVTPEPAPQGRSKTTNAYIQWKLGKQYAQKMKEDTIENKDYPSKSESLKIIFKEKYLMFYNSKFQLKEHINDFYRKLSKYTHNRPEQTSINLKSSIFNIRYNQNEFEKWFEHLKELYTIILTVTILQYPRILEVGSDEIGRFKSMEPELFNKIISVLVKHKV